MSYLDSSFSKRASWEDPDDSEDAWAAWYQLRVVMSWLFVGGLPIPNDEKMQVLSDQWLKLLLMVGNTPGGKQDPERAVAWVREFLRLACPPTSTSAPPEALESKAE